MPKKFVLSILVISAFVLNACSEPRYKLVYDYSPPSNKEGLSCLSDCYDDEKNCNFQCQKHYQQCAIDARQDAEKNYLIKQEAYEAELKEYDHNLDHFYDIQDRYHKRKEKSEKNLKIYSRLCNNSKDKDARELACHEVKKIKQKLQNLKQPKQPKKPVKPVLKNEISQLQSLCIKDCGCESSYRNCYTSCGGIVTNRRICIKNCSSSD